MKSFIRQLRDMMTRKNLIIMFCGVVLMTIAMNVIPLLRDDPVDVARIPNGWFVDGACYQVVINLDEPIDEILLESLVRGALGNYITE